MNIKKELLVYLSVVLIFAIIQHPDLLSSPLERFSKLPSVGVAHPFVFGFIIYIIVSFFRVIFYFVNKLFSK